jgi:hypothetical protein
LWPSLSVRYPCGVKDPRAGQPQIAAGPPPGRASVGGESVDRAGRRREYLDGLLKPSGLSFEDLATPTHRALHEYARFMLLVARAQSASWNTAVIELCRAVESEVVVTLRGCPGTANLDRRTLGEQASVLRSLPPAAVAWLSGRRYLPYVSTTLPNRLGMLAQLRSTSGAAHGGREATRADHEPVLKIALTGPSAVIPSLARLRQVARHGR